MDLQNEKWLKAGKHLKMEWNLNTSSDIER